MSSCKNLLSCHHSSHLNTVGDRSFYVAVVDFGNSMPNDLQSLFSRGGGTVLWCVSFPVFTFNKPVFIFCLLFLPNIYYLETQVFSCPK